VPLEYKSINLYFEDESRFGLHTKYGRGLTARGVQPVCTFQQVFKYTYLFGAFSPITGNKFLLEMPDPEEFKIIVLDNGAFHKAKCLKIPSNIKLLFLPPYSPELNPAEKIWKHVKRKFTNMFFNDLSDISKFFTEKVNEITIEKVKTTCSYNYMSICSFWSGI
jgi:hypothetical protein